ncbi:MAG: helix-turn-helix domain-containing protein [Prochlorotrichaceae cyanobacterium]|jgi:transcriptional regulator with XRE-family HTH domain
MQEQPIPQIKNLREQAGLSQTELAFLVGVSVDTIANWENGRRGLDWFERFIRLCTALRCKPQELIEYRSQTQTIVTPTASTESEQLMQQRLDELKQKLLG